MAEETTDTVTLTEDKVEETSTTENNEFKADDKVKTQADDTILQDAVKPTETKDGKADEEREGAPAEFEDFTVKEGVEVDAVLLDEFKPLAKELDLSQDNAQKLIDLYAQQMEQVAKTQVEAWEDIQKEWKEAARTDEEFGKEKFNESVNTAKLALDTLGTPALREALNTTGVGNHPEFIRFMYRVGKVIEEDKMAFGNVTGEAKRTQAQILFPDHPE